VTCLRNVFTNQKAPEIHLTFNCGWLITRSSLWRVFMGAVCWSTSLTPGSQNSINTSLPQVFLRNVATILTPTLTLLSLIFSQVALTSFNNTKCACVLSVHSFFNSLLYQLYEVLYYLKFEMLIFSYFSKLKIGVCHKFEVFFTIWKS